MKDWRRPALLLCAAVLAANAWHLWTQRTPPAWDDAWYLENSFRYYHALKQGLGAFWREYTQSFKTKAPLISLLPLPFYALAGPDERTALWANEVLLGLTLWYIYRIGAVLYNPKAGAAAAMAAAMIPLLYGLSRFFLVECLLTALVCATVLAALKGRETPLGAKAGVTLGILLGLGLLAKSLYPLYVLGPLWLERRSLARHAKTSLAVAGLLASTWYLSNFLYVAAFGLSAGYGRIARDYGSASLLSPAVLSHYASTLGRDALSWPYLLGAAGVLAAAAAARPKGARLGPSERFLLVWLAPPLAVLTLGVNKDIRFIAPALPAAALAAGAAAARLHARRHGSLVWLLILPPAVVFSSQTFGLPRLSALAYNGPPSLDVGWDRRAAVELAAAHAAPASVVAVALEHPLFNANNLASLSAARGRLFHFVNLGYAQSSVEGALIRLKDKDADLLLAVEGVPESELPAFLNRANAGILQRLKSGALPSERLGSVAVAPGITATLYRLRRPSQA